MHFVLARAFVFNKHFAIIVTCCTFIFLRVPIGIVYTVLCILVQSALHNYTLLGKSILKLLSEHNSRNLKFLRV